MGITTNRNIPDILWNAWLDSIALFLVMIGAVGAIIAIVPIIIFFKIELYQVIMATILVLFVAWRAGRWFG